MKKGKIETCIQLLHQRESDIKKLQSKFKNEKNEIQVQEKHFVFRKKKLEKCHDELLGCIEKFKEFIKDLS